MPAVSPATLRQLIAYDPDTGGLFWKVRSAEIMPKASAVSLASWNCRFAGKPALSALTGIGYLHGTVLGKTVKAHRAAWAIYHGEWPDTELDHINGNRADNRIANLRRAGCSLNSRNRSLRSDNTSGSVGVSFHKRMNKWSAYFVPFGGEQKHIGYFETKELAEAARAAAIVDHGYHDNHGRTDCIKYKRYG